jgi:hypothetical protein
VFGSFDENAWCATMIQDVTSFTPAWQSVDLSLVKLLLCVEAQIESAPPFVSSISTPEQITCAPGEGPLADQL